MIDGIKAILKDNLDSIRNNPLLNFKLWFCSSVITGEIEEGNHKHPKAKYKGLTVLDKGSVIMLMGSIHKLFNQGEHNYNRFGLSAIFTSLYELEDKLSLLTREAQLQNIEFGVNLLTEFDPEKFLESIISHKSAKFELRKERDMHYLECKHGQYYIKIYNKGLQNSLDRYILRIELKYRKMEKINRMGIKFLSDLLIPANLERLKNELIRVYDEILIGDITIEPKEVSGDDAVLFASGHNPNYWAANLPKPQKYDKGSEDKLYRADKTSYYRRMGKFRELLSQTGADNRPKQVRNLIALECDHLIRLAENKYSGLKNCVKLTNEIERNYQKGMCQIDRDGLQDQLFQNDPLLYTGNIEYSKNDKSRKCKMTGLDISMQKETSHFLCTTGLKYYKKNHPEIWLELWKRLDIQWHGCSEEVQLREIHHSIRNEHTNKIHNTKRSIQKVTSHPALFDQMKLIRKDKLETAGMES